MTNDQNIPDELLAKYMSRQTTPEEDAAVENYAAASDENLDELMHIATAMKAQAASQRAARNRRMIKIASAVAAVAILAVGISVFFLINNRKNESFAQQTSENTSVEVVSEREEVNDENGGFGDTISYNVRMKEEVKEKEDLFVMKKEEKKWATTSVANSLTIIKPAKNDYRILCKNLEKTINFEWKTENATNVTLIINDEIGKSLLRHENLKTDNQQIKYSSIYPHKILTWIIIVEYNDGKTEQKSGKIHIDYELN